MNGGYTMSDPDNLPRCVCGAVLPLYDLQHPEDFVGHWCEALDALTDGGGYTVRRDPLNNGRWQPKVRQYPDGVTPMWFDAGPAFDTEAEAWLSVERFKAQDKVEPT